MSGDVTAKSFNPREAVVHSDVFGPLSGQGRVVISASRADQISYELPEFQHGIFTKYLLSGLACALTTDMLEKYVKQQMRI